MITNKLINTLTSHFGFVTVLSKPSYTDPKNFFKLNTLTAFIDVTTATHTFSHDLKHIDNRLYNRMKFLSEPVINIINVNENPVLDEDRFTHIPVKYRRNKDWVNKNIYNEPFDVGNPIIFQVNIYNMTFEEFFDIETIIHMINEDSNSTLFFFETDSWSKIVNYFYLNGITISGGSTNNRHIFNNLDFTLSILLTTLCGKRIAQYATNHSSKSNIKKDLYKPNFDYKNKRTTILREFNNIIRLTKLQNFIEISKNILHNNVQFDSVIIPWDIIKVWLKIIKANPDKEDNILDMISDIFTQLKQDKTPNEIKAHIQDKYDIVSSNESNDIIWALPPEPEPENGKMVSRFHHFFRRFNVKSDKNYSFNKNIKIKNPIFNIKREFHTYKYKSRQTIKNNIINIPDNSLIEKISINPINNEINFKKEIILDKFTTNIQNILTNPKLESKTKQEKIESHLFEINEQEELKKLEKKFGKLSLLLNDMKWIVLTSSILSISNNKGYNSTCINVAENILLNIFLELNNISKDGKINRSEDGYIKNRILKNQIKTKEIKPKKVYEIIDLFEIDNLERWLDITYFEWFNELEIDSKFTMELGDLFINFYTDLLTNDKPIFIRTAKEGTFNEPYIIKINPELDHKIINQYLDVPHNTLPMVCLPDLWGKGLKGGYIKKNFINNELITDPKKGSNSHKVFNLDKAYDVVNKLNSIKFQSNELLLNYLENDGSWLLDELNKNNQEWSYRNLSIQFCKAYKGTTLYLPHYLDWRGRIYNHSFFLNYQGDDLCSSLLVFDEGQKLTESGKYYLFIAIANNHNEDNLSKESFWKRYNWVISNYSKIINLDKELIRKADKPFNFVSLALSLREYNLNPNFKIKNPIFLDATCSGMQHVSALIRDFDLATLTNLNKSKHDEKPKDFYNDVINKVNSIINEFGRQNLEYYNLAFVALNRFIAKTTIMTKIYNVSVHGMKEQFARQTKIDINKNNTIEDILLKRSDSIYKHLDEKFRFKSNSKSKNFLLYEFPSIEENETILLNTKDLYMVSKILNDFMFNEYEGLGKVYFFLTDIAKITNLLDLDIKWKAPNGLIFSQHYKKSKKSQTNIRLFGVVKEMHHLFYYDELNKIKQQNAIIPNMIHTLDASHAYAIISDSSKELGCDVITIHDCFGCHPNFMSDLHHIVRKTFILQYTNFYFLEEFRDTLIQTIKLNNHKIIERDNTTILIYKNTEYEIPKTPKLGDFDLKQIQSSTYIIS